MSYRLRSPQASLVPLSLSAWSHTTSEPATVADSHNDEVEHEQETDGSGPSSDAKAAQSIATIGWDAPRSDSHSPNPSQSRNRASSIAHVVELDDSGCLRQRAKRYSWLVGTVPQLAKAVCLLRLPTVLAAPPTLLKRDGGGDVKIIAPVVVVGALVIIAIIFMIVRKGWHRNMAAWGTSAAANFGPNPGTPPDGSRELTAQQLAGPDAPTLPRSRRTRRNRRTPSQISSRSLPMYMKEPGEHEVVIYRGPDDMEDTPITTNVVMPSVAEGAESPDLSIDASRDVSRIYVPMPDTTHDVPLLSGHSSGVGSTRSDLAPPAGIAVPRRSIDTLATATEESQSGLLHDRSPEPDPRGEAPPYFEVVAMENLNSSSPGASPQLSLDDPPTPDLVPSDPPARSENPRRSRFLGLFHHRHSSGRPAAPAVAVPAEVSLPANLSSTAGHVRDGSGPSVASVVSSTRAPRVRARSTTHRPSFSGSGSMFSVMSRSRSHLLDTPALTSPSMISVNSISAPLPHTLVRTEFTYPRSGPTPEQIALISSRESFARFGMPYGEEAIAFASSSRMDLQNIPPPDFEEVEGQSRPETMASVNETLEEPTPRNEVNELPPDDSPVSTPGEGPDINPLENLSEPATLEETTSNTGSSPSEHTSSPTHSSLSPTSHSAGSHADMSHPPGLHERTPSPLVPSPLSQSSIPGRTESRASSHTSFATADESLHSNAESPVPSPSVPFAFTLTAPQPKSTVPSGGTAAAEDVSHTGASSGPPTPRASPRELDDNHGENPDNETTTRTPTTPTSSTTEIGQAF